ncbi:MAG: hypothetical protein MJ119_06250 [Lachnospiraceae bacterium]|nr:hypothetical protein [Lachnospiraceae bacterium]
MVNPAQLLQFKKKWDEFSGRHPKFVQFIQACAAGGIGTDSIIAVTVTLPDGNVIQSNMKVTEEDVEMLKSFQK